MLAENLLEEMKANLFDECCNLFFRGNVFLSNSQLSSQALGSSDLANVYLNFSLPVAWK